MLCLFSRGVPSCFCWYSHVNVRITCFEFVVSGLVLCSVVHTYLVDEDNWPRNMKTYVLRLTEGWPVASTYQFNHRVTSEVLFWIEHGLPNRTISSGNDTAPVVGN